MHLLSSVGFGITPIVRYCYFYFLSLLSLFFLLLLIGQLLLGNPALLLLTPFSNSFSSTNNCSQSVRFWKVLKGFVVGFWWSWLGILERVVKGDLPRPAAGGVGLTCTRGLSVCMFGFVVPCLSYFFRLGKVTTCQSSLFCVFLSREVDEISGGWNNERVNVHLCWAWPILPQSVHRMPFPPYTTFCLWFPITTWVLTSSSKGTCMHILAYRPLKAAEVQVSFLNSDANFLSFFLGFPYNRIQWEIGVILSKWLHGLK